METLLQDIRYAFRTLGKNPVFAGVAVLCLALGIATNTTLFSCFNAIILRPFPFTNPEQLVFMEEIQPKFGNQAGVSYPTFLDWRAQATSYADIGSFAGRSLAITEGDEPERVAGQLISWNLFSMLGVRPQLGRLFREDEDQPGAAAVVLLSDAVWKRRYASDASVVGRVISINDLPYTVVGVMPPKFKFPQESELWIPAGPLLHADPRDFRSSSIIGRLKPGVSVEQGDRDIATVARRVNEQAGMVRPEEWVGTAKELRLEFMPDDVRLIVAAMMGAVTFVLLIACANVANLMLMRAASRQREIAVRAAIGAGRGRIVRQLLTEAVILAVVAGIIALPITWEALHLLDGAMPPEDPLPYYIQWGLDVPTLAYTGIIALITGVVFGLVPAVQASKGALHDALRDGARAGGSVKKNRMRSVLVVAEVALSLVLLVGASLFVRSFLSMRHTAVGFDTAPMLATRFYLPGTRYDSATARNQRVQDIMERVEAIPGVESATISNLIPLDGGGSGSGAIVEGTNVEPGQAPGVFWTGAGGHWFQTLGVAPISGRLFSESEMHDSVPVAVINQTMARKLWSGTADPVGQRFRLTSSQTWLTVVGVTPDVRVGGLDQNEPPQPMAFLPYAFLSVRNNGLLVRVRQGDPTAVATAVRDAIRASDPALPVFNLRTMDKVRELSFWQYGLFGVMFGLFGGIALFLAAIGVYGVIAYGVAQRTREIGVRVALGAQRRDVIGLIVRQGMVLAGTGIAVGIIGAFGVTRVVASLLVNVSPTDPLSFVGVTVFLAGIAFFASYLPARRATEVDPLVALRFE